MNINKTVARFVIFALFSTTALAASVPFTFTSGDPARASEVNANFAALVTAVTALEAQVAALEAKVGPHNASTLAGTYDAFEVAVDVDDLGPTSKSVGGNAATGTIVLNPDGTGQISITKQSRSIAESAEVVNNVALSSDNTSVTSTRSMNSPTATLNAVPEVINESITSWSFANGVVTVTTPNQSLNFVVVGQLLLQSILNVEGQNGIRILARR